MIKIVTAAQMREIDRKTIETAGVPGVVLMENAGLAVVRAIRERMPESGHPNITIFAGKGNNGGDGFVVARHLFQQGFKPSVFLAGKKEEVKGDARINLDAFVNFGGALKELTEKKHLQNFKLRFMHSSVIVDALLGTGSSDAPRGMYSDVIDIMNKYGNLKIAVDIPSGVDTDSGVVPGNCFKADVTVTFALPKVGLVTSPARNFVGDLVVADISIPDTVISESPCAAFMVEAADISRVLPPRAQDAHKGHFGHLVLACGSRGMGGAAAMAGAGALRTGTGLVTAAVPASIMDSFETGAVEMMTFPLTGTDTGSVAAGAADAFMRFAEGKTAVLLGPGLTCHESTKQFVRKVVAELDLPMVIDADGLNNIGRESSIIANRKAPTVVTPHPGEMARLTGAAAADIQRDRIGTASDYADQTGATVVLKGAGTIIATPSGEVYLNHTGNNGLATGGAGDVLAGMIAGLMAQGVHAEDAAFAGTYLHGRAADIYAERHDPRSLIASDLLPLIPDALANLG